jgi:hypothetical protein
MIEDGFDARTLANMTVALERVCQRRPDGEDHKIRRRVARRIIQCAKMGKKTLGELTKAGEGFVVVENSRKSA